MAALSTLYALFRPTISALFNPKLPFNYRWRLLFLQPINLLSYSISCLPWLFSKVYTVHWIHTRSGSIRTLVFQPSKSQRKEKLCPLHVSIHGGGFIGGFPEQNARFAQILSQRLGIVVICPTYRFAPVHCFPAALDDIQDILTYLQTHAADKFGADMGLLTLSGFSAGGNLALAASVARNGVDMKGCVTFYAPVNLALAPWEKPKPKPATFPKRDPLWPLLPLFDTYPQVEKRDDPRLSPFYARLDVLPQDILFVVPGIDILVHEQVTMADRLKKEIEETGKRDRKVEVFLVEKQFHGWLELPSAAIDETSRTEAFDKAVDFLADTLSRHGWIRP